MNICFIANYDKTLFFDKVAKRLMKRDKVNVYWIVVNKSNYEYLIKESQNVLYLPESMMLNTNNEVVGDYKLNELVSCDRVLKFKQQIGVEYLSKIQQPIYNFILNNDIKFIFGELTWAHELLIFRLLKYRTELNCKFLNPHTIRIPGGRFAFFEDEFQSELYSISSKDDSFDQNLFIPQKPDYLKLNDKIIAKKSSLKGLFSRFIKIFTSKYFDKDDITLLSRFNFYRIFIPFRTEVYKHLYKCFIPRCNAEDLKGKKFILLTLHKQPEASIDVLGRYIEDQAANIRNIWKQLPSDCYLVVKEHSNAVGDRSLSFYNDLLKLDRIVFVDEKEDSYSLLDICLAVVTVSGTIGYEAALLNKKALVLCDVFFKFSNVKKITIEDFKHSQNIMFLLDELPLKEIDDHKLKSFIYTNSHLGIISDPSSNPKCMDEGNISNVASAISKIIKADGSY